MVTIFSGFLVTKEEFDKIRRINDLFDFYLSEEKDSHYYVGEKIVTFFENGILEMDQIREWSTTEKVRNVRFLLSRIDDKYYALWPKIHVIF